MARDDSGGMPQVHRQPWARHIQVEAEIVEHHLCLVLATTGMTARRKAAAAAITAHLADAREATIRKPWHRRLGDRWSGSSLEQAYRSLHAARIFLVDVLPPAEMKVLIPSALAQIALCLHPTDVRRVHSAQLLTVKDSERLRAELKLAFETAYEVSDQSHASVRGFRNILIVTALFIKVFMGAFVLIVALNPTTVPLCFTPEITSAQVAPPAEPLGGGGSQQGTVCPSGENALSDQATREPTSAVPIVAGLGLLGGALASAVALRKIRRSSSPYGVPIALAFLKVPSGALTAVAGVLLLGGGFVPGLSELDSQRQILAYALVFGYAQQIATGFIDDRAQTLLASVPNKDPEAEPPTQPLRPVAWTHQVTECPSTECGGDADSGADTPAIDGRETEADGESAATARESVGARPQNDANPRAEAERPSRDKP